MCMCTSVCVCVCVCTTEYRFSKDVQVCWISLLCLISFSPPLLPSPPLPSPSIPPLLPPLLPLPSPPPLYPSPCTHAGQWILLHAVSQYDLHGVTLHRQPHPRERHVRRWCGCVWCVCVKQRSAWTVTIR